MSRNDLRMEYLQHIGSGLWAVPPGVAEGEFVGQALFAERWGPPVVVLARRVAARPDR